MTPIVQIVEETVLPAALEAEWQAGLPAERRAQLAEWPEAAARHRSLLGSRLLRDGLKRLGFAAGSLASLRYSRHGKPALDLPVHFSLAHCVGRVVCALSTAGPVGVDIEPIGELTAAQFGKYLTAEERAWAGVDPRRFYSLWTRKEAVVKAAGSRGLADMGEVRIDRGGATLAGMRWHTAAVAVDRGFVAHVAQESAFRSPPDCRRFTLGELAAARGRRGRGELV